MEYTVGSLAELISGNKSNGNVKLVKKSVPAPVVLKVESTETPAIIKKVHKKPKIFKQENVAKEQPKNHQPKNLKRRYFSEPEAKTEPDSPAKKPRLSKNQQNAAGRIKNKLNQETKNSADYKLRTVYVGNIPLNLPKKSIGKHFKQYGPIESIRIRGVPVANAKTTKKVAAIKKEFHPDRSSVYAYIRYKNVEDAKKAEAENGNLFHDHHLRVQYCEEDAKPDESKAIFVGNLSFKAEEEELWNLFKACGNISHVRIVRDGRTGIGKGFGYVNFKDTDAVQLALEMGAVTLHERELRVSLCDNNRAKKLKTGKKPRLNRAPKSQSNDSNNGEEKPRNRQPTGNFAGTKSGDIKKKNKFSKTTQQKKKLAQKLLAPRAVKPEKSL